MMSSWGTGRSNLIQLYRNDRLFDLIVRGRAPTFAKVFNATNAASEHLDAGQVAAMHHGLRADDYVLLLGMPGTGKTTLLVSLIKALLAEGTKKILISSYTHSAVDNLMAQLLDAGVPVLRIGNADRIDRRLSAATLTAENFPTTTAIREALASAAVIGTTCLSANHPILATVAPFDCCIIDEASQISVPVILGPLLLANKFILVGDHYQLPPLVRSKEARALGLDISLFRLLSEAHPEAVSALCRQYRMCEPIQLIANSTVYDGRLICGSDAVARGALSEVNAAGYFCSACGSSCTCWIRHCLDPATRVAFLDTDPAACLEEAVGSSFVNAGEAQLVANLVNSFLSCGIAPSQLCVIAAYRPQINTLRRTLTASDVEISTVDRYQGRDKDCVILSFVRSNSEHFIGSLLQDWHRLNVAFTRARKKFIMLGSWSTLMSQPALERLKNVITQQQWRYSLPPDALAHEPY